MKRKAILVISGEGGHRAQMHRLLAKLSQDSRYSSVDFVGLCENDKTISGLENFRLRPLRHKYSSLETLKNVCPSVLTYIHTFKELAARFEVVGVISTGPGIAIVPSIFYRAMGAKIVFIETWSRFATQSFTGRIMYRIAHRFYIQNMEQQRFYPTAVYAGLL